MSHGENDPLWLVSIYNPKWFTSTRWKGQDMGNAREEGQDWLFEMPDVDDAKARALSDVYGAENTFRAMVIARLERIEQLLERLLKQAENRR